MRQYLTLAAVFAGLSVAAIGCATAAMAQEGGASFYVHGKRTANGERFNPRGMTAAHRSLPFNTRVRVTDKATGRSIVVRINDRGPFIPGWVYDEQGEVVQDPETPSNETIDLLDELEKA